MRRTRLALALLLCACALQASLAADPTTPAPKVKSAQEILDAGPASAWRDLDPDNTLYLELATGRVVIELAPQFAPQHVANIRTLAHAHWFDGLSINRSQDNFVVQWGDPNAGEKNARPLAPAKEHLPAEFSTDAHGLGFHQLKDSDGYAPEVGFVDGFPSGRDPKTGQAWLAHCYGVLGAGRDMAPDSSTGAELYVVTGQSPRQLDLNITTVGRVVQGMELLSVLPRGTGPLGFYEKPEQRVPIKSIRLASDVPVAERTPLQVIRTDTPTWDAAVEARRNRRDEWYKRPAGHIDLCNVPIAVRTPPAAPAATSH
ncbi:MAG TPA: peptidylprolyl isomerase [Xanthomonadaceae bacterium]|jgi:peptidylprolyl isomerase|nr:peptidylprolyl isomerase [Xanthomonadaceae bacterium]